MKQDVSMPKGASSTAMGAVALCMPSSKLCKLSSDLQAALYDSEMQKLIMVGVVCCSRAYTKDKRLARWSVSSG